MKIQVELEPDTPEAIRRALRASRDITLLDGQPPKVRVDQQARPLHLLHRPSASNRQLGIEDLAKQVPKGRVGLVVGGSIPQPEREALEHAGLSWADGRGAFHLSWPGVLVHIDRTRPRPAAATSVKSSLGPAGIRALQVMLAKADTEWTLSKLAREGAISVGQAHNVFRALEEARVLETHGRGPQQRRIIKDRHAALDWLEAVDRSRRRPPSAPAYLYARTEDELVVRLVDRLKSASVPYAITGMAAAHLLGVPVVNKILVTHVRVGLLDAPNALEAIGLEHLEPEDAGRGMNLELWTDTGELGTFRAEAIGDVTVAPPIRVWLDLARQAGRGGDAARLFREQVLE